MPTQTLNQHTRTDRRHEEYARVSDGTLHLVARPPRKPSHGDAFVIVFQGDMADFITSDVARNLTAVQLRLFVLMWSTVGYDNTAIINVTQIAKRLNAERASVSRAFAALAKVGLVHWEAHPDDPRCRVLHLNAHLAYKGNVIERRKAIQRQTWAPNGKQLNGHATSTGIEQA